MAGASAKKTRKSKATKSKTPDMRAVGRYLDISNIVLPKKQPRRYFSDEKHQQLTASIAKHGIVEPLLVRHLENCQFELVAGERRYRAAKSAGLSEVPVTIRKLDEAEAFELALLENLQREDLNPIDETESMLELLCQSLSCNREDVVSLLNQAANADRRGKTLTGKTASQLKIIEEIFSTVGRHGRESFRTNRLPLLKLPNDVLEVLRAGELEYTKAREISKLKDLAQRSDLMQRAVKDRMSLSAIKDGVKALLSDKGKSKATTGSKDLLTEFKAVTQMKPEIWNDKSKYQQIEAILNELKSVLGV